MRRAAIGTSITTEEGKQYPTYLRSKTKDGSDAEVLLDQNEMAKGFKYFAIGDFDVSDDGNILAYLDGHDRLPAIHASVQGSHDRRDRCPTRSSASRRSSGRMTANTYSSGQEDAVSKRSDNVLASRHRFSDKEPVEVYKEKDVLFNVGVGRSRDGKMLFIESGAKTMDEYRYLAADNPTGEWKLISPRREGHQYTADYDSGEFYFVTNKDGAENFKVMKAAASDPCEKNWTDFIPYNDAIHISGDRLL